MGCNDLIILKHDDYDIMIVHGAILWNTIGGVSIVISIITSVIHFFTIVPHSFTGRILE